MPPNFKYVAFAALLAVASVAEGAAGTLDGDYVSPCRQEKGQALPYRYTQAKLTLRNVPITDGGNVTRTDPRGGSARLTTRFFRDECSTPLFVLDVRYATSEAAEYESKVSGTVQMRFDLLDASVTPLRAEGLEYVNRVAFAGEDQYRLGVTTALGMGAIDMSDPNLAKNVEKQYMELMARRKRLTKAPTFLIGDAEFGLGTTVIVFRFQPPRLDYEKPIAYFEEARLFARPFVRQ